MVVKREPDTALRLPVDILAQPDDTTCGPTCLHAVYRYFDDDTDYPLDRVIAEVPALAEGGTLGVFLACHALRRGYDAKIYTYNLQMFDPTWFDGRPVDLAAKLRAQAAAKAHDIKLQLATAGYLEFLSLGGEVALQDLKPSLIRKHLKRGEPILTGLSSTFLYRAIREHGPNCDDDDVRGLPAGHFVVLCGYDKKNREVTVADPHDENPFGGGRHVYLVKMDRLIAAILLGVITYDANLLVLRPGTPQRRR